MNVLLALLPIIIVLVLLIWCRMASDLSGVIGWISAMLVAWLYFETSLQIVMKASLSGIIASLPITLMIAASLFQITVMIETGAIARVVDLVKTISPKNQIAQIMIVNMGVGTMLAALGATPVSILPPIMIALGYSSFVAIAVPALGYDALCTYALLGVPLVVFSNFVGKPVGEVGGFFARYMPVISTCIALGMLWIVGGWKMIRRGIAPALLAGITAGMIAIGMNKIGMVTLTGVAAGLGIVISMILYLILTRQPLLDIRKQIEKKDGDHMSLVSALSPWIFLVFFATLLNAPFLPFFDLTFNKWAMPIAIIPNAPEKMRLFWQAYFWVLISTLLALPFLKTSRVQFLTCVKKLCARASRPMLTSMVFFAIAFVMNHSGKTLDWQSLRPDLNMVSVIANGSATAFGRLYPLIAPFLGLLGGFISGSETSAIAMLTPLHLSTAQKIGFAGVLLAAASGIGGGLASVISPVKLQNAAAAIDRIGDEARVLPVTFVISLIITFIAALLTIWWSFSPLTN